MSSSVQTGKLMGGRGWWRYEEDGSYLFVTRVPGEIGFDVAVGTLPVDEKTSDGMLVSNSVAASLVGWLLSKEP